MDLNKVNIEKLLQMYVRPLNDFDCSMQKKIEQTKNDFHLL